MNPGTTSLPPASITSAPDAARWISAVVPTDVITSPLARSASAQGLVASPVQIRALMSASVAVETAVVWLFSLSEQDASRRAQRRRGSIRIGGSYRLLY